jgi:hypothetical protein
MGQFTEHVLDRTTTVMLSGFHASAGPLKETPIHFEERQSFNYDGNLDICQPIHYMTMSTSIDDDSERHYDDHDDASLPELQPFVNEIYVIIHYCHDCPVKYQESDQLPVQCQPRLLQPHSLNLDQLPSMTTELILAASDTISTLSCSSQSLAKVADKGASILAYTALGIQAVESAAHQSWNGAVTIDTATFDRRSREEWCTYNY